jgi:hypothetical protein
MYEMQGPRRPRVAAQPTGFPAAYAPRDHYHSLPKDPRSTAGFPALALVWSCLQMVLERKW